MRRILSIIVVCLSAAACFAQSAEAPKTAAKTKVVASKPKETAEQKEARLLLEQANSAAVALSGGELGDRISATMLCEDIAKGWRLLDKTKALKTAEQCSTLARAIDDDSERRQAEVSIVGLIFEVDANKLDEMEPTLDTEARREAHALEFNKAVNDKDYDKAMALAAQMASDGGVAYMGVARLMGELPTERRTDRLALFHYAEQSYEQTDATREPLPQLADFATMLLDCWRELPADQALAAFDLILNHAETYDKENEQRHESIAIGGKKGEKSFESRLELRLFELLPMLRELDESRVRDLLVKYPQLQAMLQQYPQGLGSLTSMDGALMGNDAKMIYSNGRKKSGSYINLESEAKQRELEALFEEVSKEPKKALTIIDKIVQFDAPSMLKAMSLMHLARSLAKPEPVAADAALRASLKLAHDKAQPEQMAALTIKAVEVRHSMGEDNAALELARQCWELGNKIYKQDTNHDDPNLAPRVTWPSAASWRAALTVFIKLAPEQATTMLGKVEDVGIRGSLQTTLAINLLGGETSYNASRIKRTSGQSWNSVVIPAL